MSKTLLFLGSGLRRFRAASPKLIEFKLSDFPTENGDGICRLHQDFKIRDLNSVLRFSQIRFPRSLPAQNCSASAKPKLIEFKLADFPTENGDGICRLHFLAEMERFEFSFCCKIMCFCIHFYAQKRQYTAIFRGFVVLCIIR